jgi:hypothetical protein
MSSTETIILITSDGGEVEFSKSDAKYFSTINNTIEDIDVNDGDMSVPLPKVTGAVLDEILKFKATPCFAKYRKYFDNGENHTGKHNVKTSGKKWNKMMNEAIQYFTETYPGEEGQRKILRIIIASNYMDCTFITKACSNVIAQKVKGLNPEEMKKALGLPNTIPTSEQVEKAFGEAEIRGIKITDKDAIRKKIDEERKASANTD